MKCHMRISEVTSSRLLTRLILIQHHLSRSIMNATSRESAESQVQAKQNA